MDREAKILIISSAKYLQVKFVGEDKTFFRDFVCQTDKDAKELNSSILDSFLGEVEEWIVSHLQTTFK